MTRLFALLLVLLFTPPALGGEAKLVFLHINDVYEISPVNGRGGFAPLKTLLDRERERAGAAGHVTVLSGDFLSPSAMSGITKGAHMIALGNELGIDIAVPGNHEFDFGIDNFRARLAESRFPWIVANLKETDGRPFNSLPATLLREINGVKVGFMGLLTPATRNMAGDVGRLGFEDFIPAAQRAVKSLKEQGAEVVVALTHLTFEEDVDLSRSVAGIDLILGGHEHEPMTLLESGTLVHKSGQDARWLGVVELTVGRDAKGGVMVTHAWRMEPVRGIPADPAMEALVAEQEKRLSAALDEPVGKSLVALDSRNETVRYRESSFGNLVADALRHAHGAEAAIVNGGGLRGNRLREAGETITRRDLVKEMPFGNVGILAEVAGADLKAVLERGLAMAGKGSGAFPQVSGIALVYDPAKPAGERLVSVKIGGRPLEEKRLYRLATSDFILRGGDGQKGMSAARVLIDPSAARPITAIVEEFLRTGPYDPGAGARISEKK